MDNMIFESARLRCRRWQPTDLAPLLLVYGDADKAVLAKSLKETAAAASGDKK